LTNHLEVDDAANWVISAAYPEQATIQLARHLSAAGLLNALFLPSRRVNRLAATFLARRHPAISRRLKQGAIDVPELSEVAPVAEPLRQLSMQLAQRGLVREPMRYVKLMLDNAVSTRVGESRVVVGLPGSSLRTFPDVRVFQEVDAHPAVLNDLLLQHFGKTATREMIEPRMVHRISEEIAMSDLVLSPSRVNASQLQGQGVDASRIAVIPYATDGKLFRADVARDRRPGRVRISYVGQVSYRKGITYLLAAIQGLDVELTIVGPAIAPELLERLPGNVIYRRQVAHSEVVEILRESDAFVYPSIEDSFALAVAEAQSQGLPIISTAMVGATEQVPAEQLTLVEPGEVTGLRAAIARVEPREAALPGAVRSTRGWARYAEEVIAHAEAARRRGAS
jgi:glycosyltransferase involved in cell wall biosynthesis